MGGTTLNSNLVSPEDTTSARSFADTGAAWLSHTELSSEAHQAPADSTLGVGWL